MKNQAETITAFPLTWPVGWQRTQRDRIKVSRYKDHSLAKARKEISEQVRLLGGKDLIISSNLILRDDGLPRSKQRQPEDMGVAAYFAYKGKPMCFACDTWKSVEDNFWAISLTISAIRQIERAGAIFAIGEKHHPDAGGDLEAFHRVQMAYEAAMKTFSTSENLRNPGNFRP